MIGALTAVALAVGAVQAPPAGADVVWSLSSLSSRAPRGYDWALEWDRAEVSRSRTYARITWLRLQNGKRPWIRDQALDASAQAWAEELSRTNRVGYSQRGDVYENFGFSPNDPNEVLDQWLATPGHRDQLLDSRPTRVGLGAAHAFVDGQYGFIVVVQAQ